MAYNKTQWNPGGAPGISAENLNNIESGIESAHKLVEADIHTPDQAQIAQASGTLVTLQGFFANMLKRILGATNWYDAPPITLQATKTHTDAAAPHTGHATTTALTAHTSAAAPHSGHATTSALSTHTSATSAHSATSAATANRIMLRDAAGRAKVAAPAAADDIARKDTVDAHAGRKDNPHVVTAVQIGAANLLTELLKVDGAGSGLDADLLDGKHASAFALIASGSYVGSGSGDRTITVGFAPKSLKLFTVKDVDTGTGDTALVFDICADSGIYAAGKGTKDAANIAFMATDGKWVPQLTSNGFMVNSVYGSLWNVSARVYYWVALG